MDEVKSVVVLGGGSAGWLTAIFIKKNWPDCKVIVVEDPNGQPIIAGESCTMPFVDLLEFLGVDISEWVKEVDAVPKLGGKFLNWTGPETEFIQPLFSSYRNRFDYHNPSIGQSNNLLNGLIASNLPISQCTIASSLIEQNKVPFSPNGNVLSPMWHFDSRKNARFIKNIGQQSDIQLIESKFLCANIEEDGSISSLELENKSRLSADWFFDCSGFAQLLLKKTLNQKFHNYSKYFSAHSVVAWWDDSCNYPYTEMTAMKYGWSFNVSLRSRAGRGYIYDNSYINKDQAIEEINRTFNKNIEPVAAMTWSPEVSLEPWKNNVIAVGLSSGFLEPLGSPGHTLIGLQLQLLLDYWNPCVKDYVALDQYNKKYKSYIEDTVDFISLHYQGNRNDSEFWLDKKHRDKIPETLHNKFDLWNSGIFIDNQNSVYSIENYVAVLQGLNILDTTRLKQKMVYNKRDLLKNCLQEYQQLRYESRLITNQCIDFTQWKKIYD